MKWRGTGFCRQRCLPIVFTLCDKLTQATQRLGVCWAISDSIGISWHWYLENLYLCLAMWSHLPRPATHASSFEFGHFITGDNLLSSFCLQNQVENQSFSLLSGISWPRASTLFDTSATRVPWRLTQFAATHRAETPNFRTNRHIGKIVVPALHELSIELSQTDHSRVSGWFSWWALADTKVPLPLRQIIPAQFWCCNFSVTTLLTKPSAFSRGDFSVLTASHKQVSHSELSCMI